jgi:hypothetical protein
MSISTFFITISLSGILAAIVYYLRQAKSNQEFNENPALESDNVDSDSVDSDNKAQPNVLLMDTVILVIFFCLLLILGTQLS